MKTSEAFLVAMLIIFAVPYLVWRLSKANRFAPLGVVQIIIGIVLGPGVLGAAFPDHYASVFDPRVMQALDGISRWAVMLFVWIGAIELDLKKVWEHKRESGITAACALAVPMLFGGAAAAVIATHGGWVGPQAQPWQFILGIGMSCAVTALPVLILLMEDLAIIRQPIGQRLLRYASADDLAVWSVLALILMDAGQAGRQICFLVAFAAAAYLFRKLMARLPAQDRWYVSLIWLAGCALAAEGSGLHFLVGAFLAGAVIDPGWFETRHMDSLRHNVSLIVMSVYFCSAGLRANWTAGGIELPIVVAVLLAVAISGKLAGTAIAGRILKWQPGEATTLGWLLQTKGLMMISFGSVLLDKQIITGEMFTALLLMAAVSTLLTVPIVAPRLPRTQALEDLLTAPAAPLHDGAQRYAATPR
jgi:K+:H+ antiporter